MEWPTNLTTEAGETRTPEGKILPFQITEAAALTGRKLLLRQSAKYRTEYLRDSFQQCAYGGLALGDFLKSTIEYPLWFAGIGLVAGLILAIPMDRSRALVRKHGRRVRGPELVSASQFNRRFKSDGIGFVTLEKPSLSDRILHREWQQVRIPRSLESSHGMGIGDTGQGKTVAEEQIAAQVEERDETAIIYDPGLQLVGKFYRPERGDVILNALDARMPYWSPSDEILHPAEALTLAAALFPERAGDDPFFVQGVRKIMAHLLNLKPTPQELLAWLSDEKEIDRRLKGTTLSGMIYQGAGPQRGGMFGTLSMIGDSLKLLPRQEETKTSWTAAKWAEHRRGWIFITSVPEAREQLLPLISMWLDMLILRLMNQGRPGSRRVWFLLDELQTLHKLPQLPTALAEGRKSDNALFLFFQGRSQLEATYGHEAEAMLSQPKTKLFLGTSEPRAAKWISDTIGDLEWEHLEETKSDSQMPPHRETRSYHVRREVTPLVMKEEISGLGKGYAYLKVGNLVVKISFPFMARPKDQPSFILRDADMTQPPKKPAQRDEGEILPASGNAELWK